MAAQNNGQTVKKLYFDVQLTNTQRRASFACTPFRANLAGDRHGALLAAFEACTAGSPAGTAQRSEASAFFVPTVQAPTLVGFNVFFSAPTVGAGAATRLPGVTALGIQSGGSAAYGTVGSLRQFSVTVEKQFAVTCSVLGVLYVQRQHSVEV